MASLIGASKPSLVRASRSSPKYIDSIHQVHCGQIHTMQTQPHHLDATIDEIALTFKGTRYLKPTQSTINAKSPTPKPKIAQKIEESRIAKMLREEKARVLGEQEYREVQYHVRDAMAIPMPFIVQKLKVLQDAQVKELRKRQLEQSYKSAMDAVAKGDTSKVSLLDASFV